MSSSPIRITHGNNPYAREVQGKANEPITVAALLDRARAALSAVKQRGRAIAPTNRLAGLTDAARGVVPLEMLELIAD